MNPTYPGVYIQEATSPVHPIAGVATSIAALVGYTDKGIDNRAEHLFSFSDFERLFGGLAADSELSYAVQQFFQNGGTEGYVVRVPKHGATAASVSIIQEASSTHAWKFFALSSGSWADGNLLVDIDFNGIGEVIPGTLAVAGTAVTGIGTHFSLLEVGQWLAFAQDIGIPHVLYQIATITGDTVLTLHSGPAAAITSTAAAVYMDNQACNVTITNLADGTVESFPDVSFNSNNSNYLPSILNDFDTGSQLVNVTPPTSFDGPPPPPPVPTGIVGRPKLIGNVLDSICGGTVVGGVTVASNSATVTGFAGIAAPGQSVIFSTDPTSTIYTVSSLNSTTHVLTLTSPFVGAPGVANATVLGAVVNADWYINIGLQSPATAPAPLPVKIKIFSSGISAPPQSLSGFATLLQTALNNALSVALPGSSVQVSAVNWWGAPAIRLYGIVPNFPDAVFQFQTTGGGFNDLAIALGLDSASVLIQNVSHYALGTGNLFPASSSITFTTVSSSTLGSDGSGLPQTADLIGDPSLFTGIYALDKVDLFNLLLIPDATRALGGNPNTLDPVVDPNAIYATAIAYCDQRRAFLLLDAPPNINTASAAIDWKTTLLTVNDPNGAAYFPRLRLPDPVNNYQLRTFAPCGVVAGLYARIDGSRGVWKAPAGTEATLSGVQTMAYKLTDTEQGAINPLGLNCARIFPVYGPIMWGARTLVGADAEASQWKYVPVRRVALYIEESLYRGTKWVVFEPNDEPLWASIRLNVGAFMDGLFRKQAFQGQTADEAYFVKCDSETTTQADIDLGIVNILVGFAPLKPAEFVVITISQMSGQAQS
ncbi:MAG TPA: phage tail sheath C-terminal domain-containing protein [Opitutaceae bacterium]|jgi:phage tail sheath protein FI|nr:phage tail sheath C-terminal domain-containing protein [Opitutaceae bacterium]